MPGTTQPAATERPIVPTWPSAALVAFACTLAYSGMKATMALRNELGLPGFPAKPGSYDGRTGIARDEWILAALGLVAACVALATLMPRSRRVPRWIVAAVVLVAGLSQASGAAGMTLRALRILPELGPGPQGWTTWAVLLILDAGAIAWLVLGYRVARRWPP